MDSEFYYYIFTKSLIISDKVEDRKLPFVVKININNPKTPLFSPNDDHIEGPYKSIFQLRKSSIIFNKIQKQTHRDNIVKTKNIKTFADFIVSEKDKEYTPQSRIAFHHVTVGKIHKGVVKGIHFYDPEKTKILEILQFDEQSKVYSAKISKYDITKNIWVEKESLNTFFPDDWTLSELNYELDFAYNNKEHFFGNIFFGTTTQGIKVKFIIRDEKIITIYPEL